MRITGGKHKNRKIQTLSKGNKELNYRPTAERTRLAIFNLLENAKYVPIGILKNAVVADIFCGCGSFGIEALSRGASRAVFVDQSSDQLELVAKNLKMLNEEGNAIYLRSDATLLPKSTIKLDIVYLDPPYHLGLSEKCLMSLVKGNWFAEENLIIIEQGEKDKITIPTGFELLDERRYGKTKIIMCKYIVHSN